ncbi:hypothetical protein KM043_016871 [Ampulex compressa]|nr:hypothetical protein KM043_016871 [Ampulex compressa]
MPAISLSAAAGRLLYHGHKSFRKDLMRRIKYVRYFLTWKLKGDEDLRVTGGGKAGICFDEYPRRLTRKLQLTLVEGSTDDSTLAPSQRHNLKLDVLLG